MFATRSALSKMRWFEGPYSLADALEILFTLVAPSEVTVVELGVLIF